MKHNKIYSDGKFVPQRMCVACRSVKPKVEMIRVSLTDGVATINKKGNLSGRGAYVCNNEGCILKAQKIRGLERGLKAEVPAALYEECIEFEK